MRLFGVLLVLSTVIGAGYFWTIRDEAETAAGVTLKVSRATVESLQWSQAIPLAESVSGSDMHQEYLLDLVSEKSATPAIYAAMLVYLARGESERASSMIEMMDLETIPTRLLYPVFRIREAKGAESASLFSRLASAAKEGELEPLVAGRVLVRAGEFQRALAVYRRVRPQNWSAYDLAGFQLGIAHEGYRRDFRALLNGALRSSAIHPEVREQAMALLNQGAGGEQRLVATGQMVSPQLRSETKLLFLQKKYADLHAIYADSNVRDVSDEGVLLLFVSAVAINDRFLADKWGFELDRRANDMETRQWIASLKTELG